MAPKYDIFSKIFSTFVGTGNTVYQLRRLGLPVIHLGRSVRFDHDEIIDWIRSNRSVAAPAPAVAMATTSDSEPAQGTSTDFLL